MPPNIPPSTAELLNAFLNAQGSSGGNKAPEVSDPKHEKYRALRNIIARGLLGTASPPEVQAGRGATQFLIRLLEGAPGSELAQKKETLLHQLENGLTRSRNIIAAMEKNKRDAMEKGWHTALCMAAAVYRNSGRLNSESAKALLEANNIDPLIVNLAVKGPPSQGFNRLVTILWAALASADNHEVHLRKNRNIVALQESLFKNTQDAIEAAIEGTAFQAQYKEKGKRRMFDPPASYESGNK